MGRIESWQFRLVYVPGTVTSVFRLEGVHGYSKPTVWDAWTDTPQRTILTEREILDQLWIGATEALERHSDKQF